MKSLVNRVGSKARIEDYIHRVQDDIHNRMYKAERKRQKKCLEQENELKKCFKPNTNITKYQVGLIPRNLDQKTMDFRTQNEELLGFDQSKEFNQEDYDLFKINEAEKFLEIEEDFK